MEEPWKNSENLDKIQDKVLSWKAQSVAHSKTKTEKSLLDVSTQRPSVTLLREISIQSLGDRKITLDRVINWR